MMHSNEYSGIRRQIEKSWGERVKGVKKARLIKGGGSNCTDQPLSSAGVLEKEAFVQWM